MYDISIFMPAIRTSNWDVMYDSIEKSCKRYSFELIMCGPFPLTEKLKEKTNVKMIIDNGSPSRCAQIAAIAATGKLIVHTVDDAIFIEDSLDQTLDLYNSTCTKKDVVNLRYTERENFAPIPMASDYWLVTAHPALQQPGVPLHYKWACHHLIDAEYFKELGGYDCQFEYQNMNLHDFMFRLQHDGGQVHQSPCEVTNCDWVLGGEHAPIEAAHNEHDLPLFTEIYSDPDILSKRVKIPLNNWEGTDPIWHRRFSKGVPKDYEELIAQ